MTIDTDTFQTLEDAKGAFYEAQKTYRESCMQFAYAHERRSYRKSPDGKSALAKMEKALQFVLDHCHQHAGVISWVYIHAERNSVIEAAALKMLKDL